MGRALSVVDQFFDACSSAALGGAVDAFAMLHPMADHGASAARAMRRKRMNRTLKRIENVMCPVDSDGERVCVTVAANFTCGHDSLLRRACAGVCARLHVNACLPGLANRHRLVANGAECTGTDAFSCLPIVSNEELTQVKKITRDERIKRRNMPMRLETVQWPMAERALGML